LAISRIIESISQQINLKAMHDRIGGEEKRMGKMRENPRYNVISMRISDEERAALDELMNVTNKSVSQLMREAMDMIRDQLDPELNRKAA
jgi:hypothetical protein